MNEKCYYCWQNVKHVVKRWHKAQRNDCLFSFWFWVNFSAQGSENLSKFYETCCMLPITYWLPCSRKVKIGCVTVTAQILLHPSAQWCPCKGSPLLIIWVKTYLFPRCCIKCAFPRLSNLIPLDRTQIQAHQELGLKQISQALGSTLLLDRDRTEKKTFQETSKDSLSFWKPVILTLEIPLHLPRVPIWENVVQPGFKARNLANALSICHCCLPANSANRMPAEGTTGSDSLLHYPSSILLLTAWVGGFFLLQ